MCRCSSQVTRTAAKYSPSHGLPEIFGEHTYGLSRFGELMVYASSGAGTWGPPMRVGTCPEIVLIRFE